MIKLNLYLRFGLIAACLILGLILQFQSGFLGALPFYLGAIILAAGYFLLGTVASTAGMIQNGDFEGAEANLKKTIKPEWLFKFNRAYYHLLQGTISAQKRDNSGAKTSFEKALDIGLSSQDETAMLHLQLANIAATKNNWQGAQLQFKKLKGLQVSDPQLKEQIQQFEKALKQRGQMKNMRHMQQGGKKGRRKGFR